MSDDVAQEIYNNLADAARRHLQEALSQGSDRWGYRCSGGFDPKGVVLSKNKRYYRWESLSSAGFLTPLGVEVARIASGIKLPKKKRRIAPEL